MKKKALSVRTKYTLGGILFGLSFPLFSQFIDCILNGLDFNWTSIILIHQRNVIHYVVDTAPVVLGAAGFLLGKTHQKKNDSNQRLRVINESLDTLTYKITHDLRGPALNIKNLAEILKESNGPLSSSKQKQILDLVHTSVSTWLQTFEDFMSLLRHEKSGDIEKKECSLDTVISNLRQELSHDISESEVQIETNFIKGPSVFASEIYLNSIFKNLITNSIKYARPGRVARISISSESNGDVIEVKFKDNGQGIDLDMHGDKLFSLFQRFTDDAKIPGSGIGLYLVKQQVEKNNGTINISSIPNEGTIFTIELPVTT